MKHQTCQDVSYIKIKLR